MQKRVYAEMCDFHMAALMFLTGKGIKARTHACTVIAHFPTWCIITAWKALGLQPHAPQALMMHLVGKCVIPTRAWVLALFLGSSIITEKRVQSVGMLFGIIKL